ncbi:uncharacterized protein [Macrobrachium rosenbergii]|uniref:uncharacterized protein n=1 Tax=Macrobrachium rosenbergii TaxID=79674 RepID=UPI0034D5DBA6
MKLPLCGAGRTNTVSSRSGSRVFMTCEELVHRITGKQNLANLKSRLLRLFHEDCRCLLKPSRDLGFGEDTQVVTVTYNRKQLYSDVKDIEISFSQRFHSSMINDPRMRDNIPSLVWKMVSAISSSQPWTNFDAQDKNLPQVTDEST